MAPKRSKGKTAFVTVGTTKFDALIRAVDSPQVVEALRQRGFTRLQIQLGSGFYLPTVLCGSSNHAVLPGGFEVRWFDFVPSLQQLMQDADLIISHAGSGSLFEALHLRKAIIAVPNAILMANHQAELAGHLAALGHLVSCTPDTLVPTLLQADLDHLQPYQPGDPSGIVQHIDAIAASL